MTEPWAANPEHNHVRDYRGYGEHGLQGLQWPNNAKIAVSFVVNYEEVPETSSHKMISKRLIQRNREANVQSSPATECPRSTSVRLQAEDRVSTSET